MVRLIPRQRGDLTALKPTKLFEIDAFPSAKDSGKDLIIIIYCYLIIIILTRPTCWLKYGTTRNNIQRYYTTKRLIRYICFSLLLPNRFRVLNFVLLVGDDETARVHKS